MAVGNELGYFAVFFRRFDDMLPFTVRKACHGICANVKTLSIFSIILLLFLMVVALSCWLNASGKFSDHEGAEETDVTANGGCGIQLGGLVRILLKL
ncbi:hypothetical protein Ahy_A04g017836 [Arachis hypogaea]|uniref:Uncharacterized protein n=1 Tax=Arachis hypogaea TaxID=3818 RepID=A0A445DC78_ARAHY|nr:hypothetical protein Ahy_A04g017836 [Arachis hypogaea]